MDLTVWNNANYDKLGIILKIMLQPSALRAFSSLCFLPCCLNSAALLWSAFKDTDNTPSVVLRKFLANLKKSFYSKLLCHIWHLGVRKLSFLFFVCVCVRASSLFLWSKPTQVTRGGPCVGGQLNSDPLSLPSPAILSPPLFSCPLSTTVSPEERRRGAQEEENTHSQANTLAKMLQLPGR